MNLVLVTPPAAEPISLEEAKLHLRVDHEEEDGLISDLIVAAREWCEQAAGRSFVTQTWRLSLSGFPCGAIEIPRPPLVSVSSVTYTDDAGAEQLLPAEAYYADTSDDPGRLHPAYGSSWPAARCYPNSVQVEYVAGYGDAEDVPRRAAQAVRLLVGHWFANREEHAAGVVVGKVETAAKALLQQLWHGRMR